MLNANWAREQELGGNPQWNAELHFFKFCYSVLYSLAYKLLSGKFGMHSLSLLHKTASGNVGTEAVTTPLKQQGHISGDVILILDQNFFCRSPKNTLEETHSELMKMEICTRGCSASWSLDWKIQLRVSSNQFQKNN